MGTATSTKLPVRILQVKFAANYNMDGCAKNTNCVQQFWRQLNSRGAFAIKKRNFNANTI